MKEIEISEKIEQLLIYAQQNLNLIDEDVVWSRNYLLDLLKVKEPFEGKTKLVPLHCSNRKIKERMPLSSEAC